MLLIPVPWINQLATDQRLKMMSTQQQLQQKLLKSVLLILVPWTKHYFKKMSKQQHKQQKRNLLKLVLLITSPWTNQLAIDKRLKKMLPQQQLQQKLLKPVLLIPVPWTKHNLKKMSKQQQRRQQQQQK